MKNETDAPPQINPMAAHVAELERQLQTALGTRVSIRTNGRKMHRGKIIIEFYSLDDFDRIQQRLSD